MLQANSELRMQLRMLNIPFWKLAEALGCHEQTVIRRFRHELPADEKQRILNIINDLKATDGSI